MSIATLTVALEDVEPKVTRTLEVPTRLTLNRLHFALQASMGWENGHLYEFEANTLR